MPVKPAAVGPTSVHCTASYLVRAWLFLKTDEASDPSLKKFILWLRSRQKEEERCSSIKTRPRSRPPFGQRWAESGDKPVEQVLWCAELQASTTEIASSPHFPSTRRPRTPPIRVLPLTRESHALKGEGGSHLLCCSSDHSPTPRACWRKENSL